MTTVQELYTKGTSVWIPSEASVWQMATLLQSYDGPQQATIDVAAQDGQTKTVKIGSQKDLPPLRNPDIFSGLADLTQLSYLHEPAVLHNLRVRFVESNIIYTYCGIVLVAINPYQELSIYDHSNMETYRGSAMGELDPHIFAIAEEAYTKMERDDRDQSIIVSGESGAGKTVNAKYAMRYFASVKGSSAETNVEKRVLATSPIMEAIGNAKTTRNDNSSRFGKFIEIDFDKHFSINGAKMRTYLLEKSRVVFQSNQERNYHIFYQLCAAANDYPDLRLKSADQFRYTSQGGDIEIDGVDDYEDFEGTRTALDLLSFPKNDQDVMFRILAAVLHLGDVSFVALDQDSSAVKADDTHLETFAWLLGINKSQLSTWLTKRKLVTAREQMSKPLRLQEAEAGRDAFAKHIYARLFSWVVTHVNKKLVPERQPHHFIGVLDIYGFETFERNSFEQFCINYANEKLQQQFVIHVFKLEQEEYIKEEIEWAMIDFFDNQPCIDLIEGRLGILDLLDEECKVPKGSDQSWVQKMYVTAAERTKANDKNWKYFEKPRFSNEAFIIRHFADQVQYECEGFLDKNRDTMNEEFVNLLRASEFPLVALLFSSDANETLTFGRTEKSLGATKAAANKPTTGTSGSHSHKTHTQSVGSQFKDSLSALMNTLTKTTPHYVRCIKPNDEKKPFDFDPHRAIQQLRACGVLETIRISAAGYPTRWTYQDFFLRYRVMCHSKDVDRNAIRKTAHIIVQSLIRDADKYKLGKTMIFFRAGQVAYMEKLRTQRRYACGLLIQKTIRGWLARKKYLAIRQSAIRIQTLARGMLARRHYQELRRTKAATQIQAAVRGFVQRRRYERVRRAAIGLQARIRGRAARLRYRNQLKHRKAIIIQKHVRGWLARQKYKRTIKKIVLVQSLVRRYFATKQLKALKIEARNVDHVKQLNKGLENKIISLQQRLNEMNGELQQKRKADDENRDLRQRVGQLRHLEQEVQQKVQQARQLVQTVEDLRREMAQQQKHTEHLTGEIATYKQLVALRETALSEQAGRHTEDMARLKLENQALHEVSKSRNDLISRDYDERMEVLNKELTEERDARQRLIDDLDRIKQRHANLEDQLRMEGRSVHSRGHGRSPSDVSTGSVASLESASTGMLPEVGDDGYSTQRSKNTNKSRDLPLAGDDFLEIGSVNGDSLSVGEEQMQNLTVENQSLKHQLQLRPPADEVVAEKIRVQFEENLALKHCLRQCLTAFEGRLNENERDDLMGTLQQLTELGPDQLASVTAEGVGGLDAGSLSQLFLSLREALEIQARETRQLMDSRQQLSQQYTNQLREKEAYKALLTKLTRAESIKSGRSDLMDNTGAIVFESSRGEVIGMDYGMSNLSFQHVMLQNEALLKENKDLRRRVKLLEKNGNGERGKGVGGRKGSGAGLPNGHVGSEHQVASLWQKKGEFQGILEFNLEETDQLVRTLVSVSPQVASQLTIPGLPAYFLFMAVRYTDLKDNERAVKNLLSAAKAEIEGVLKRRKDGPEYFALWLLNGLRLVDLLKQYSGDEKFQKDNSAKQNQHCLKQFDLSVFRQHFDDLCVSIYRSLVSMMQKEIKDDAAKAIIEHESVLGLNPKGTLARRWKTKNPAECMLSVVKKLESFFKLVTQEQALDPALVRQIIRQLLYCLSAHSVNFLMQSQKSCTFVIGIQIRANISQIQEWVRSHASTLQPEEVMVGMAAVTECAHILQARKQKDEDIDSIINMSKVLSNAQIYRLLQSYVPSEDFDKISPEFLKKMAEHLQKRPEPTAPGLPVHASATSVGLSNLTTLNTDYVYPVVFPYSPSKLELDSIQVPQEFGLTALVRKI